MEYPSGLDFVYLSGHSPLRFNNSTIYFMRPCFHSFIHFNDRGVCYKAKPSWTLVGGVPHHLENNKIKTSGSKNSLTGTSRSSIFFQVMLPQMKITHTTQSVRLPHVSKCARKLSSVVSKLRPPINSFLSCSGSLDSRSCKSIKIKQTQLKLWILMLHKNGCRDVPHCYTTMRITVLQWQIAWLSATTVFYLCVPLWTQRPFDVEPGLTNNNSQQYISEYI